MKLHDNMSTPGLLEWPEMLSIRLSGRLLNGTLRPAAAWMSNLAVFREKHTSLLQFDQSIRGCSAAVVVVRNP